MRRVRVRRWTSARTLFSLSLLLGGCGHRQWTPDEIAKVMEEHANSYPSPTQRVSYTCRTGDGDWDYLCQVRFEPTALGISQNLRPNVRNAGLKITDWYNDRPGLTEHYFDDGLTPSSKVSKVRK
jgi:hypothetical protein